MNDHAESVYEPLAQLIRDAMDAGNFRNRDIERLTGLERRHVSWLATRKKRWSANHPPKIETLQALEKVPGLSQRAIARAVAESMGTLPPESEGVSPLRATVRGMIEQLPEEDLRRAMKLLMTLFE